MAVTTAWMSLERTTFDAHARTTPEAKCLKMAFGNVFRSAQKVGWRKIYRFLRIAPGGKHRGDHDSCHLRKAKKRR